MGGPDASPTIARRPRRTGSDTWGPVAPIRPTNQGEISGPAETLCRYRVRPGLDPIVSRMLLAPDGLMTACSMSIMKTAQTLKFSNSEDFFFSMDMYHLITFWLHGYRWSC